MSQGSVTTAQRMIALALGLLLAAGIWLVQMRLRGPGAAVALVDNSLSQQAEWTSRQLLPRGLAPPSGEAGFGAKFRRRELTTDELTRLLGTTGGGLRELDPHRLIRYTANVRMEVEWPDYPGGHWTRVTNSDGAREDHDFPSPPPDIFVLVAGDSHTEGVCDNAVSYSNLLEGELLKRHPGKTVEVYNTGMNGYSFYNYLGTLEGFLARKPKVFISTFFAGNDYYEVLKVHHVYAGSVPPPRPRNYWKEITKGTEVSDTAMAQALIELLYLRENPDQANLALQAALYATSEMQRVCVENGIRWLAVYLPSAFDLPFPEWKGLREHAASKLSISEADFEIANRLGDQLLATLRERGVEVLDLRPVFRAQTAPLYWNDLHINLKGQEVVAEELLPRIEALLAR
ncbi:MAG: SGNH/GDSL hydrolase family protein [Planctomycetota bacterium]